MCAHPLSLFKTGFGKAFSYEAKILQNLNPPPGDAAWYSAMQINPTAEQFVPAHLRRKVLGEYLLTSKYLWFAPAYLPTNLPGKTLEVNERNRISRFCFPFFFFFSQEAKRIFTEKAQNVFFKF